MNKSINEIINQSDFVWFQTVMDECQSKNDAASLLNPHFLNYQLNKLSVIYSDPCQ